MSEKYKSLSKENFGKRKGCWHNICKTCCKSFKTCPVCNIKKDIKEFYKVKGRASSYCKICHALLGKKKRANDKINKANTKKTVEYIKCKKCNDIKHIYDFRPDKRKLVDGTIRCNFYSPCKDCDNKMAREFKSDKDFKQKRAKYNRNRRKSDVNFKLRGAISTKIYNCLKKRDGNKNNLSCLKFLNYTIAELKQHLESQFEPWMNWSNWGKYIAAKWDDSDSSTWVWQIDHIMPESMFKYLSMADDDFKKCWALENLRPYSAKQNIIDGTNRVRHVA